jgi:nicotinamidase-related amidase
MKARLRVSASRLVAGFIDLQEEHRQDPRYLVQELDLVLSNVRRLQATARKEGIALRHWAYVVDADDHRPFNPKTPSGRAIFSPKGDPLTRVCPEVAPEPGEPLTLKSQPSALSRDSGIAQELLARGVEWLLVAGVWTEGCVDATVKDAVAQGLRVLLVKDACGSGTRAMHQVGILNIANRLYGGAVTDTEGACHLMSGEEITAWQLQGSAPLKYTLEDAGCMYAGL